MSNTIATARSNDIVPVIAVQDISQLRTQYSRDEADLFLNITGNLLCGQVGGETARWVSERFPKIQQPKESVSTNVIGWFAWSGIIQYYLILVCPAVKVFRNKLAAIIYLYALGNSSVFPFQSFQDVHHIYSFDGLSDPDSMTVTTKIIDYS
jgi:hypothetical protein